MFKLRDEHVLAFELETRDSLVDRILDELRLQGIGAAICRPEPEVRQLICDALTRAAAHGLRRDASLTQFAGFDLHLLCPFDENPALKKILRDTSRSEPDRMTAVYRWLTGEDRSDPS